MADSGALDLHGLNALRRPERSGLVTSTVPGLITLTIGATNVSANFAGVIQNGASILALTKTGTGTETLNGLNTYSGTTTISAGTLRVGNGVATASLGSGSVIVNAALAYNLSNNTTVANSISGTGSLTQTGVGTIILSGANSYSGATTIGVGTTLQAGSANALSPNSSFANAGTLNLGGFSNSISALSGSGTITNSQVQVYQIDDGALRNSAGTAFGFNNSLTGETEDNWIGNVFTAVAGATQLNSVSFATFSALSSAKLPSPFVTAALYLGSPATGLTLVPSSVKTVPLNAAALQMVTVPFALPQTLTSGQVFTAALLIDNVPTNVFPFISTAIGTNTNSYYDVSSPPGNVNTYNLATPTRPRARCEFPRRKWDRRLTEYRPAARERGDHVAVWPDARRDCDRNRRRRLLGRDPRWGRRPRFGEERRQHTDAERRQHLQRRNDGQFRHACGHGYAWKRLGQRRRQCRA